MTIDPMSYYSLLQAYVVPGLYGINPSLIAPVVLGQNDATGYTNAVKADQAQISALGQLVSAATAFQTAMQGFETQSQVSPAQASSTNQNVASASALATAATGTYNVAVNQLAQTQTVESAAFADSNSTVIGSGTLTIQLGSYNSSNNTFAAGSSPAVSVSVTNGSLNSIASAINNANAGVTASVVQDSGGYHLVLTSTSTGTANGFEVTTQDSDGTNTDMTGLSQLAYDPTAAAGAGKNLTLTQAAQNASLTVNGVAQTSASNAGVTIATGLTLNLGQTGSATVSVTQSTSALQTAAQSFVNAYNSLLGTLNSLTGTSGSLATDPNATQLRQGLSNTLSQTFNSGGTTTNLVQLGITTQANGTLALDSNALQAAYTADPTGTIAVLNQAAQAFDNLSNNYAGPAGSLSLESQTLQQDVFNQQLVGGAATNAASVSQQQGAQEYQAALVLGYQNQLAASEFSMLLAPQSQSSTSTTPSPFAAPSFSGGVPWGGTSTSTSSSTSVVA